jgi:hypothetical protein
MAGVKFATRMQVDGLGGCGTRQLLAAGGAV